MDHVCVFFFLSVQMWRIKERNRDKDEINYDFMVCQHFLLTSKFIYNMKN